MREKTLLMIKPDGVARGLVEEITQRVAAAGLTIVQQKKLRPSPALAADLYSVHLGKPFYDGLVKFITSGEVVANIVEGENAILKLREVMGATDPRQAAPGSIRGDLKEENIFTPEKTIKNLVHGSDSADSFRREAAIFFKGAI